MTRAFLSADAHLLMRNKGLASGFRANDNVRCSHRPGAQKI
jgi:hypothetical protein